MGSVGSLRSVAGLCVLLATAACFFNRHRAGSARASATPPASSTGEIALAVTNHNFLDVVVYVLHQYIEWTLETDLRRSSVGVY